MKDQVKQALLEVLIERINEDYPKQVVAAAALGITQPQVSNLMNKHFERVSVDTLLGYLSKLGYVHKVTTDGGSISLVISPV